MQSKADLIFGGITIVCGILGTIAGGCILDLMTSTISNAFKVGTHVCIDFKITFMLRFMHHFLLHCMHDFLICHIL